MSKTEFKRVWSLIRLSHRNGYWMQLHAQNKDLIRLFKNRDNYNTSMKLD